MVAHWTSRNVGIQLLAILVSAISLPAFDPRNDGPPEREEELVRALVDTMLSERKVLYEPAAEVYGSGAGQSGAPGRWWWWS